MINYLDVKVGSYIDRIRETKSLSGTATEFGVQYQTILIAIRKFEKKIGINSLFLKNKSGVWDQNPEHNEVFNICQQLVELDKKVIDISMQNKNTDNLSLYATQTLIESFFCPHYHLWIKENSNINLSLKEDDGFNVTAPLFNEVTLVKKILNDQEKYHYFPFHNFRQKLWASPIYAEKYGPFKDITDLDGQTFLLQKISYLNPNNETKELIGFRGIIENILSIEEININFLNADGVRTVDVLCEAGLGIIPASGEPIRMMGRNLVNILPDFYGDSISIYVKVRKDSFSNSESMKSLVKFIYVCRDYQLKKIGSDIQFSKP